MAISSNPLSGGGSLAYNPIWSGSGTTSGRTAPVIGGSVFFPRIVRESILTVHNISSAVGNYIIEFYYMNGAQFNSDGFTIPAGGYYNYPVSESIPPGVLVSAVIHSDQMMAAVVSTKWPNSSFTCTGYKGITTPSTTAFVPFISKNNLNTITRVGVQNTGSTTTDCTIQYFDESGALAGFEAATIQPSAYHDFDQAAAAFLPDGFKGSAVINSIQPIAVVGFISRNSRNIVTAQSIYMPLVLSKYYKPSCPGGPGSPPILYSVTISPNSGPIDTFLQINLIFFEFHFNDPNGDMGSGTFNWDFPPGQVIRHQLPENLTGITSGPVFFIHRIVTSNQKRYLWYSNVAR